MRIGMVTACYNPVINGVTRMVALYKAQLEALGHEVYVFTLGEPDPKGDDSRVIRSAGVPLGDTGYYLSVRYSQEARAMLQEMDILHCHHLFMSVEMAHRYARCPIVYTNHTRYDLYAGTHVPVPQPTADAFMRRIWPEFTDFADVVITPSESVRQVMIDFGVRRPIEVIENGVDLRPFHTPPAPFSKAALGLPTDDVLFMYVGRLSAEKRLQRLIEQFAIAQDLTPDIQLLIVGDGPRKPDLVRLVQTMGLAERVHLVGAVSFEDVANYLAAADVFVTASESEVHPLSVIEGMAAGLPVVAQVAPGIVDTVNSGETGLLTRQPEGGLAAAMCMLASQPALRRQMSTAARAASDPYSIENTVAKTVQLYERLLAARPDLGRDEGHGRSGFNWNKLQTSIQQLGQMLWPPERWVSDKWKEDGPQKPAAPLPEKR